MRFIQLILYLFFVILGFVGSVFLLIGRIFNFLSKEKIQKSVIYEQNTTKELSMLKKIDKKLQRFDPLIYKILGVERPDKQDFNIHEKDETEKNRLK